MVLCINPICPSPENSKGEITSYCLGCGSELLIDGCYRVTRLLSDKGGFGVVYEAINPQGESKILKILKQDLNEDSKAVSLFQQEAFVLGKIEHAGIPKIEAYIHHHLADGKMLHGIVMQKIEGLNLEQWIHQRQNQPIAQKRAIAWMRQLIDILTLVHAKGYFHRDIKPANIMLSPSGQLVLIDFGTAREATHTYLAKVGSVQGVTSICSVGYTAPEQEKGFAVPQSDFYALGCTMIHLVTGKYPLDMYNPELDLLDWRSQAPDISEEFADLVDALISQKPSDRPLNCASILGILKEIERIDQTIPAHKRQAKRKLIKKSIQESARRPHSPILLTFGVIIAGVVGLSMGMAIRLSALGGNLEDLGLPQTFFRQNRLVPTRFLTGHTDAIQSLALSPNRQRLASASDDGMVKIWAIATERIIPLYEFRDLAGWVRAVVFLSDQQVVTAGLDKNIRIVDIASGKVIRTMRGHTNLINSLAIAPKADLLVSGSYDQNVNLWQISTGKLRRSLKGHTDKVLSVALSPDQKQVASASRDKTIKIWDVQTGKTLQTLGGANAGVNSEINTVLFTPDGKQVISAGGDRLIRGWDIASGKQVFSLSTQEEEVSAIALTSDGKYLLSGGKDQTNSIRLWNLQTKSLLWNLTGHTDLVTTIILTPNNLRIVSGSQDKTLAVWEMPTEL